MKKTIAIIVCLLSFGAFADSYLYWMVGDSATVGDKSLSDAGASFARVAMADASGENVGYLNLYDSSGVTGLGQFSAVPMEGAAFAGLDSAYSYYIELVNDQGTFVGRSELYGSDQLANYIGEFGTGTPADGAWNVTSFTSSPIPEPNSAMLVLLGMAALGLRRKQKKA